MLIASLNILVLELNIGINVKFIYTVNLNNILVDCTKRKKAIATIHKADCRFIFIPLYLTYVYVSAMRYK